MERRLSGLAASTGLAFGPAVAFRAVGEMRRETGPVASERQALADAVAASLQAVTALAASLHGEAADTRGEVLGCGMNSKGVAKGGGVGMAQSHCNVHGNTPIDL